MSDPLQSMIHPCGRESKTGVSDRGAANLQTRFHIQPVFTMSTQPVKLRFLFVNHENVTVEVQTDTSSLVSDVKKRLLAAWPSAKLGPAETSLSAVRLICMGQGILPDHKTLAECRVPVFAGHATPVNVSIKPKAYCKGKASAPPTKPKTLAGETPTPADGCFCTIQ